MHRGADRLGDAGRMVAAGSTFAGTPAPIDTRAVRSTGPTDHTVAPPFGAPIPMRDGGTGAGNGGLSAASRLLAGVLSHGLRSIDFSILCAFAVTSR
jgi:hypothetical protein